MCEDHDFDQIRLENPIAVYHNEAAPLSIVRDTLSAADRAYSKIDPEQLAAWHFDDELIALAYEQQTYSTLQNGAIKQHESAIADPSPFLMKPARTNGTGILLIHGLLASPAELRDYGRKLTNQGFTVLGVRLKGHGTSPNALRDLSYEQWFDSVLKGFTILKAHCGKIVLIGFSTGGALALKLAAENRPEVAGVVAVSVPVKFMNPSFMLVSLLHNTNSLVRWLSSFEGVKPFIDNTPEHPDINYCNTPIRALFELRRLIQHLDELLPGIETPTLLLYADRDPIVAPESAETVFARLGATRKYLHSIDAERHGILMENIGETWSMIDDFLSSLQQTEDTEHPMPQAITEEEAAS